MEKEIVAVFTKAEIAREVISCIKFSVTVIGIITFLILLARKYVDFKKSGLLYKAEEAKNQYRVESRAFEQQMALIDKLLAVIDKTKNTADKESKAHETIASDVWNEIKRISNSHKTE